MLISGFQYDEVSATTGIEVATLRAMKCNALKAKNSNVAENTTLATDVATAETLQTTKNATGETPDKQPINAGKARFLPPFWQKVILEFSPYDLLYYVVMGIAVVGIVATLQVIGYAVAFVYMGVAVIALQRCKEQNAGKTAEIDLGGVIALELFVGFPAHVIWVNRVIWDNIRAMPFKVEVQHLPPTFTDGMDAGYSYQMVSAWPFYIAVYVALLLVVSACYACFMTLRVTRHKSQEAAKKS